MQGRQTARYLGYVGPRDPPDASRQSANSPALAQKNALAEHFDEDKY